MFGLSFEATIAAGVALVALFATLPLLLGRNFLALAGVLAVGGFAWTVGGLTPDVFGVFTAGLIASVVAAVDGVLVGFGVADAMPFSTGGLLFALSVLFLFVGARSVRSRSKR